MWKLYLRMPELHQFDVLHRLCSRIFLDVNWRKMCTIMPFRILSWSGWRQWCDRKWMLPLLSWLFEMHQLNFLSGLSKQLHSVQFHLLNNRPKLLWMDKRFLQKMFAKLYQMPTSDMHSLCSTLGTQSGRVLPLLSCWKNCENYHKLQQWSLWRILWCLCVERSALWGICYWWLWGLYAVLVYLSCWCSSGVCVSQQSTSGYLLTLLPRVLRKKSRSYLHSLSWQLPQMQTWPDLSELPWQLRHQPSQFNR